MSKKKEDPKDEMVECVTWKEITYTCPTRGKVTQKVKVVKYKTKEIENKEFVKSSDKIINDFDMSELTGQELDDEEMPRSGGNDD